MRLTFKNELKSQRDEHVYNLSKLQEMLDKQEKECNTLKKACSYLTAPRLDGHAISGNPQNGKDGRASTNHTIFPSPFSHGFPQISPYILVPASPAISRTTPNLCLLESHSNYTRRGYQQQQHSRMLR